MGVRLKKAVLCLWSVLQRLKRRIVIEDPIRKDGELIIVQPPERKRSCGICSCILIFDPRVLFTGVFIQRMETHFGSYSPGNSTEVSCFSLCCWFEYLLEMCREVYRVL